MTSITETELPGVWRVTPRVFADSRGTFSETWNAAAMTEAGLARDWVQDNQSLSSAQFTLRGMHFQQPPHAQAKLVRCVRGAVYDVAVDIRIGSPTFGHWTGVELSAANHVQLFVSEGFAHGFLTLMPDSVLLYKCSSAYAPNAEGGLRWDCPEVGIDWPLSGAHPVVNDRDAEAPFLSDVVSGFTYEETS